MPRVYAPVGAKPKEPHATFVQAVVGPGAGWEYQKGGLGLRMPAEFTDGLSNTVLVVEAGEAVPWTKPADVDYDPKKPLPKFGGQFKDGYHILFADGSVRFVRQIDEATLRAILTRSGGEAVD